MAVAGPMPSIVGALSCQKDSYLQALETEVVSCNEYTPPKTPQQSGKSKTKKSTDPEKGLSDIASKTWLIEFADSVIFPEGGGQPTDHGFITALDNESNEPIPVTNIQRHGLRCVHFSPKPLEPGTPVRQTINFTRRWDHMQQHTGQHLLSAIMDGMDLPTLGWSMGVAGEMNYVELPRKPTDDELQSIQSKCNEMIRENLPITVETPEGKGSSSLPEDYDKEKGVVRFIKIGDMDYNACCGTHLKQTSHVALILLHHTQSIRGTNCRLFFTAGDRAIKLAAESINGLRTIAVSLSSSATPADVASNVNRLTDQVSDARRKEKKMLAEIAKFESERLTTYLETHDSAFSYRATDGLDFINSVVSEIREVAKERVVVLCSGEVKTSGSIVIFGKPELVERMAVKVKEVVSTAKGGGKGEKWQGKVTEWKKGEVEQLKKAKN
ncbi:ThrRS/AlaRS common domain-containing protein [Dothidotthia symphoricarpi CBS 119687]|uniref:ThrRS/AlaRS common domain-containing protein n=1 Tax=Dothidotthia symphoricarpi CBS 119687 TaxID=1392245 RepID=A0A6A6AMM1_9PLEO|nr:ThrRS/AlaRS common domain-containing protein [Dothidotthia symphoricarpi CBS 119687]KAF2132335.1 ThrRS/AlaRS common domain-containing protein [Dothidotthia symphoricarpi CBS 119687]